MARVEMEHDGLEEASQVTTGTGKDPVHPIPKPPFQACWPAVAPPAQWSATVSCFGQGGQRFLATEQRRRLTTTLAYVKHFYPPLDDQAQDQSPLTLRYWFAGVAKATGAWSSSLLAVGQRAPDRMRQEFFRAFPGEDAGVGVMGRIIPGIGLAGHNDAMVLWKTRCRTPSHNHNHSGNAGSE